MGMKTFLILLSFISFGLQTFAAGTKTKLSQVPGRKVSQLVSDEAFESSMNSPTRSPAQFVQDREVMEKAKSKSYKGGAEEGELRVQAQLQKPQRKIAPVVDKRETDKETQDHD